MAQIEGGTFRMGSDVHYPEERPAHDKTVDCFWIDRHPVTNADFAAFVAATGYVTFAERPLDPAVYPGARPELLTPAVPCFACRAARCGHATCVTGGSTSRARTGGTPKGQSARPPVGSASLPCMSRSKTPPLTPPGFGKDLPTEAEWEFAARGGLDGAAVLLG